MPDPLRLRQSRLRSFTACPLRTINESEESVGFVGAAADLGSAFHAIAAEILLTLRRQGEQHIPTEEGVNIMREQLATGPWVLGMEDLAWLRQFVLAFCERTWTPERFVAVEKRLLCEVLCPDGEIRTISGTPDLLIAEPPDTVACLDWKTGQGVPRTPRELPAEGEPIRGTEYLSEGGYAQLAIYSLLVMRNYPSVQRVILREISVRWGGAPREAVLSRAALEHVEREVGLIAMQLDTAMREGEGHELAKPRPGPHCVTRCPIARRCPVAREERGLGVLETLAHATAEAQAWEATGGLQKQRRKALVAFCESTGQYVPVGNDRFCGWFAKPSGGREFAIKERTATAA
jgi:hypothetical protein